MYLVRKTDVLDERRSFTSATSGASHLHAERVGTPSDFSTDSAQAYDQHLLVGQLPDGGIDGSRQVSYGVRPALIALLSAITVESTCKGEEQA
jgi:hypothetical protein